MTKAEIMLPLILFHDSAYYWLKHFYLGKGSFTPIYIFYIHLRLINKCFLTCLLHLKPSLNFTGTSYADYQVIFLVITLFRLAYPTVYHGICDV